MKQMANLNVIMDLMVKEERVVRYGDLLRLGFHKEMINQVMEERNALLERDAFGYSVIRISVSGK